MVDKYASTGKRFCDLDLWPFDLIFSQLHKHPQHTEFNSNKHNIVFYGNKMAVKVDFWAYLASPRPWPFDHKT